MRDVLSGLQPALDLVLEGGDTPEQAEMRRRAALAVASRAKSAEDCALLLDMLGLHTDEGGATEVA
jgi:hypothetical protein